MSNFETIDFFTDPSLVVDPMPYFEYLRSQGPITALPMRNTMGVTGYEEAVAIINDPKTFSSANAATGPIPDYPFTPEGDDISEMLDAHRHEMLATGMVVAKDGLEHANHRALLMRLFTPTRLKESQAFLSSLAGELIDDMVDKGHCDLIKEFATPYATLVIANLLGVPEADRKLFCEKLGPPPGVVGEDVSYEEVTAQGFMFLFEYFAGYIAERQAAPCGDVLSDLATSKFPDGTTPEVMDLVWLAAFLFGAGQDTTARLLGASLKVFAENPELQEQVRADRSLIPAFIEEVVRFEGPVKCASRLAVKTTTVAGVEIKAGTTLALFYGAANRDPRKFDNPNEFRLDRPRSREHIGFGRGAHTCAGMALARAEITACLERILDRVGNIQLSESKHGKAGERHFSYEPIYTLRALKSLHLEFTKI